MDNIQKIVTDQLRALPHENSSNATGSDNVSGGVWFPKGTTLKSMMLIFNSVVNRKFYSTSRITF
jgi:hypothetical protein